MKRSSNEDVGTMVALLTRIAEIEPELVRPILLQALASTNPAVLLALLAKVVATPDEDGIAWDKVIRPIVAPALSSAVEMFPVPDLRVLRESLALSQYDVAKAIGIRQPHTANMEHGGRGTPSALVHGRWIAYLFDQLEAKQAEQSAEVHDLPKAGAPKKHTAPMDRGRPHRVRRHVARTRRAA